MRFQTGVIIIAVILLIVLWWVFWSLLSKSNDSWPPVLGNCPDYWMDLSESDALPGTACYNAKRLGTCNLPSNGNKNTMNFGVSPYTGSTGTCSKYRWAQTCGVTWDGITYGAANPCDDS